VLRPPKARLEFENAVALRRLGLPAVEPLAWGGRHCRPGESLFVTRCQDGAEPLQQFLDATFRTLRPARAARLRRRLAVALGAAVARLHDAGVAHTDPHPGNLLVEFAPGDVPRFTLIDLHATRFGPPLPWRDSLDNLVLLNRWFQLRATRHDRVRFWAAYVAHRTTLPTACPVALARMAKDVERRTERSNARFWHSRFARYRKGNRQFYRVAGGRVRGHAVRDLPDILVRRLAADPDAPFRDPAAKLLKDSRSSTVVELTIHTPAGPRAVIFKRFRMRSWVSRAKNVVRRSPAVRSWVYGHNLLDRGLPTARPLLVLERVRAGVPGAGYLLTEKVPDAVGLPEAVAGLGNLPPAVRRAAVRRWADTLGRLARQMHARQVSHRDLKAPNILLTGAAVDPAAAAPVLIDLVGVCPGRCVPAGRVRARDLARLNASFLNAPAVSRTDRLRFLRAYLGWGLHGRGGWKAWWAAIDRQTRAKAAKNLRSGRPLA
jgi:tRNA A-37 threonylcarbamoyl transferase component Bud32